MKKSFFLLILFPLLFLYFSTLSQQISHLRGPNRDGHYHESRLLKQWPDTGPDLLWSFNGIGNGYSSPVVSEHGIFVNGEINNKGFLFAFNLSGSLRWEKSYGEEWIVSFPGPRSTPVVSGEEVYILSGNGDLSCFDAETGKKRWAKDLLKDLKGSQVFYGFSESLLIDGDTIYCMPGGEENNVVALNRKSGKIIWSSEGSKEAAGYISPISVSLPGKDILVAMSEYSIFGLEKQSGKVLWVHDLETNLDLSCNYPVYYDGHLYYVTGPGNGAVKLELSPDGDSVNVVWKNSELDAYFGGFIIREGYLYGSMERKRKLGSINISSGEVSGSLDFYKGAVVFADDMMYAFNEKGEMGLIALDHGSMELISSFRPEKGTREPYAHPIIHNGILYLRHGKLLMAYDIRKK